MTAHFGKRDRARAWAALLVLAFLALVPALAVAQTFPALTGRVVDAAQLLEPEERSALAEKLAAFERETTHQVVVATIPALEGLAVEDYANRLFREWRLGQKDKNNGVLLLVAPNERQVRIEVGYGLEGQLTDALSKLVIETQITPSFRQGDYASGILDGVSAILAITSGDTNQWQQALIHENPEDEADSADAEFVIWFFMIVVSIVVLSLMIPMIIIQIWGRPTRKSSNSSSSSSSGSSWSSSSRSSDFSGGGGSSGGGGASGRW